MRSWHTIVGNAPDNMDGLELLVHPDRCQAQLIADGSVDLARASDLYKRLYTIRQGADHSFRVPSAGMRFELYTRFGESPGVEQQILAPKPDRVVTGPEARFVERHAYFTKLDDGYYYWDYQKMRRANTASWNSGSIPRTHRTPRTSVACLRLPTPGACLQARRERTSTIS